MYDMIVIGGGCGGLPAGMYAARYTMKVLVLAKRLGGLIQDTHLVENYPGFTTLTGYELAQKLEEHARAFDAELKEEEVIDVEKRGEGDFVVKTDKGEYNGKTVLFATGSNRRKLGVPGEEEYLNKGVSYCATCDAPFFKGKVVAMVGGGDSAVKEALLLADYATEVKIIYRKAEVRPEPINLVRMKKRPTISVIPNTNVIEVLGDGKFMNRVKLDTGGELELGGLFIEIGHLPSSELAQKLGVAVEKNGEIIIEEFARTNIPGVFAAGDVTNVPWKQGIVAAAQGCYAAYLAYEYIGELEAEK